MISWWRRKQREMIYRVIVLTAMQCGRNLSETQKLIIYNKCVGSKKVKEKKRKKNNKNY